MSTKSSSSYGSSGGCQQRVTARRAAAPSGAPPTHQAARGPQSQVGPAGPAGLVDLGPPPIRPKERLRHCSDPAGAGTRALTYKRARPGGDSDSRVRASQPRDPSVRHSLSIASAQLSKPALMGTRRAGGLTMEGNSHARDRQEQALARQSPQGNP